MKLRFSNIVIGMALFMPYEQMLYKYIPCSDSVFGIVRLAIEIIGYILFAILIMRNMSTGKILHKSLIDVPYVAFLLYSFAIIFIAKAEVLPSLVDIRSLLKYSMYYFIIANIDFDYKSVRKLLNMFVVIACVQSLITAYQHFFGISQFWYPRASALEVGGKSTTFHLLMEGFHGGREQGSGIGTFGDTIPLSNFMVMAICLVTPMTLGYMRFTPQRMLFNIITLLLIIAALFFSYSRGSVLMGFLAVPLTFIISGNLKKFFPVALVLSFFIIAFVAYSAVAPKPKQAYYNPKFTYTDPVTNFLTGFTSSYADNTMDWSRGYVISFMIPKFLASVPLAGFGPSQDASLTKMADIVVGRNNFHSDNIMIIADVWWLSLLACYGIIGSTIFLSILVYLYYGAYIVFKKSEYPEFKIMGIALMVVILVAIPYTFIIRTFLFRPFAFYFWMFAGIVASEYRRIIIKQKETIAMENAALRMSRSNDVNQISSSNA